MDEQFARFAVEAMPRLTRLARALVGSEHDCADLVQETLVRVGSRWSRVHRHGNPVSYAMTTLVRLNIDRYRRVSRERPAEWLPAEVAGAEPDTPVVPRWLVVAWAGLTPAQRTVVALRYLEELDMAEIAEALGCEETTVRSHLSRGLGRLRAQAPTEATSG